MHLPFKLFYFKFFFPFRFLLTLSSLFGFAFGFFCISFFSFLYKIKNYLDLDFSCDFQTRQAST